MEDVERVIVETLEEEIEVRIRAREKGAYSSDFGTVERAEAMRTILGRAIKLARENGVSAYDLALYFADACAKKCIHAAKDAWFEHSLHYAEIEFGGIRSAWGKL